MKLMTESVPQSVKIGEHTYSIDCDFRNFIKLQSLIREDMPDWLKVSLMLNLFFDEMPEDIDAAFDAVFEIYDGPTMSGSGRGGSTGKIILDFEQDSNEIYAAFMSDYGIDLNDIPFLHWHKFLALLSGLKPDNLIVKIMGYRAADLSKLKGEERKFYQKMQKRYRLNGEHEDRNQLDDIRAILQGGGDLSDYLGGD